MFLESVTLALESSWYSILLFAIFNVLHFICFNFSLHKNNKLFVFVRVQRKQIQIVHFDVVIKTIELDCGFTITIDDNLFYPEESKLHRTTTRDFSFDTHIIVEHLHKLNCIGKLRILSLKCEVN